MIFRLVAIALVLGSGIAWSEGALRIGAAAIAITPKEPMWMAGYAARKGPADGKQQELYAKALAIQDESDAISIIVTTDLIGMPAGLAKDVSTRVENAHGIPRGRVMLTSSHTHSGPAISDNLIHMYGLDDEQVAKVVAYTATLTDHLERVINEAIADIEPGTLHWGNGHADFAVNRREYTPNGVINRANPIGPVDHDVPTLLAKRNDGSMKAVLFGYACHNTTLDLMQWCGDYAGFAQEDVENAMPGTIAMFATGCGADANPIPRRTLALAQQYGKQLADAVLSTVEGEMSEVKGPLSTRYKEIPLTLTPAPSREEVEKQLESDNVYIQRRAKHLLNVIEEQGSIPETYPYPVQVWKFSDTLQMSVLGGEVVVDYALLLKHEFGSEKQFVIGYANDVCSYIPSLRVLLEGGYEGAESQIYYGFHGPWATSIETDIMTAIRELAADE